MTKEALELVRSLNNETYIDGVSLEFYDPFEFISTGNECGIKFMGFYLWTEDNDERDWITEHEKEPLRRFILNESKKILKDMNQRMAQI